MFLNNIPSHFTMLCNEKLKVSRLFKVKTLKFRFAKFQHYQVVVNPDDPFEEICNAKALVDGANAGRHRGLRTTYIENNLFHQSKSGQDVELQNTYIVSFESSRDLMQVTRISAQLGLASDLIDWYRNLTSIPYGHLSIELSPQTDSGLRYCTNNGSSPSIFFPQQLKHMKSLDDDYTKLLYSPGVPIVFSQMPMSFLSILPNRVYQVFLLMPKTLFLCSRH